MRLFAATLACSLALAPFAHAQSILRVEPTGAGGAYLDIQAAIDAASPGDLVLVETGTYPGFSVSGKGLTVAADSGAVVEVDDFSGIGSVPFGSEVVLSGMTITFEPALFQMFPFDALAIGNCQGHVLLQDMTIVGEPQAVRVFDSESVAFVNCDLTSVNDGGAGIFIQDSHVFLHDSRIQAGVGSAGTPFGGSGFEGGAGIDVLAGSTALVVGCDVTGGMGGPPYPFHPTAGAADGGPAVRAGGLPGEVPPVLAYDSTFTGGPGGVDGTLVADDGPEYFGPPGAFVQLPNTARRILLDPVVRAGEQSSKTFTGDPFDFLWHIIAIQAGDVVVYLPDVLGAIHPGGSPFFFKYRGLLDVTGQKTLNITLSATGLEYVPIYEQALMYSVNDGFVASNPRMVAFLDASVP